MSATEVASVSLPTFQKYAAFYDLLYRDKDYAAEAAYIARLIRDPLPSARTILELGSGTGRHGRILASMGFEVHGIERSPQMVSLARASTSGPSPEAAGSFQCEVGDICTVRLGRTFDAVIALFHVMSYQTTDRELEQAFGLAATHLEPGGLFVFDAWHGPAVLAQGPSQRVKEASDEQYEVRRTAQPKLDIESGTVKILFHMNCKDRLSGEDFAFEEEHTMRYLFPAEVELFAMKCGLRLLRTEEFLSGAPPSPSTWGVAYILQR